MAQAGHFVADLVEVVEIQVGDDEGFAVAGAGDLAAPGIVDDGVTVAVAVSVVVSPLVGGEYVALVFDGAGLQEWVPVVAAGGQGEGGGNGENVGVLVDQGAVEFGKAQVVADRQADVSCLDFVAVAGRKGKGSDDDVFAGLDAVGFAEDLVAFGFDVKEVNFAVDGGDVALRIDEKRCVEGAFVVFDFFGEAAEREPALSVASDCAVKIDHGAVDGFGNGEFFVVWSHEGGVFGEEQPAGAGVEGSVGELLGFGQVLLDVAGGSELYKGGAHGNSGVKRVERVSCWAAWE